jgi:hypothetical protein
VFQEVAAIERLHQEGDRTISERLFANVIVIMRCDQDDGQLTPFPPNATLQLCPVDAG